MPEIVRFTSRICILYAFLCKKSTFPRRIYFPTQNVHFPTQNVTKTFSFALIINKLGLIFEGQNLGRGTE